MLRATTKFPWVLVLLATAANSSIADDPKAPTLPLASDPIFKALRLDGTTVSGKIRQLGPDQQVVLVEGSKEVAIPFTQLFKLTREGEAPASPPEGSVVVLPEGDRLVALIGASGETSLDVSPKILGDATLPIPLDAMLGLLLSPDSDSEVQESLLHRLADDPRASSVVWLANGDRQDGDFLGLTNQKVTLQRDGKPVVYERSGVVAIAFDPAQAVYPKPTGAYLELSFHDGSRLGVRDCRVENGQLVATTRFGAVIKPSMADLDRVYARSDAIVYLSEKKEAIADFVGYLGSHRGKYARDRTVDGQTLRMRGQPYDRGLGTYARTLLAYRLDDRDAERFQALVGLDDRAGAMGSVVFRVLVNGKEERFVSAPLTARDAPVPVDVDLKNARNLILTVEFGDRGDIQDFADWVEARIIRKGR